MMKSIKKIRDSAEFSLPEEEFIFQAERVQGAKIGKRGNATLVLSPRRFKLFTDDKDLVKILSLEGEGHFKWARGETPFCQGDCFEVSGVGEYELTANGKFLIIRK